MLKIRLQRVGRKAEPTFRLVLTDSKNATKSGKYLENLGNHDSRKGEASVFKADRISHWISKGAQVSTTVHNLLINNKIITGKKINALPLKKAIVKEEVKEEAKETPAPASTPEVAPVEESPKEAEVTPAVEESVEEKTA